MRRGCSRRASLSAAPSPRSVRRPRSARAGAAAALLEIPYEELIADQEGWTRRMLEFIGLPWDARCRDFHRIERIVSTFSRWQARQPINTASVERWRHYEKFVEPLRPLLCR